MTDTLSDVYDRSYFMGGKSNYSDYGNDPGWAPTVAALATVIPPGGRILELGSATGWFVKAARDAGYDVVGIDISEWATTNAVTQVFCGDATVLDAFKRDAFDAVVSWEFLEHLSPAGAARCLAGQARVTKPGGLLLHRIGMDLEDDPSWAAYPSNVDDDPTHTLMRPRWWWEREMSRWSTPWRAVEHDLDLRFVDRDWWGRFLARRVTGKVARLPAPLPDPATPGVP